MLPHRPPFLFTDRLLKVEPGVCGEALVLVGGEPFSPVFIVEAMAQLGGIASVDGAAEGGFLAAITKAEFKRAPAPGNSILVQVRIIKSFGALTMIEGEARVAGDVIATANLTIGAGRL